MSQGDDWSDHDENILAPENLARLKAALEQEPLIVEHRHFRAASAPDRLIFDDYDELHAYLHANAHAGDHLLIWRYSSLSRDDNLFLSGKFPDPRGLTPRRGSY